ncbi:MAG: DUF3823 domain-containing protein [Flavobacterium sp.]|nr:DUF3823 domain-containing protein [Flavobacterium sp.]
MDKFIKIITLVIFAAFLGSCELDNLDEPTAGLSGKIIDEKTGELVTQDIINGTVVEIREFGYATVGPQNLVIKNSGNYENSRLFENKYMVMPIRPNFQPIATQEVVIKGQTKLDFTVKPFIRLLDAKIEKVGTKVVATFKMEQTTADLIKKIGLYSNRDPNVGEFMQTAKTEVNLNAVAVPDQIYTVELETAGNINIVAGKTYYFRVGALTVLPETRSNYAPLVVSFTF